MQLAGCYYVYHCIFAFFHPELKIESLPANKEYQWKVNKYNFWLVTRQHGGSICRTWYFSAGQAMSIGTGGSQQDKYSSSYKTPNYTQYTETNYKGDARPYKNNM